MGSTHIKRRFGFRPITRCRRIVHTVLIDLRWLRIGGAGRILQLIVSRYILILSLTRKGKRRNANALQRSKPHWGI